jgi:succinyl-CoA synthetase beta subunit
MLIALGITRCDMIAEAIIAAAAQLHPLRCPIVVRLQGTNAKEGQKLVQFLRQCKVCRILLTQP